MAKEGGIMDWFFNKGEEVAETLRENVKPSRSVPGGKKDDGKFGSGKPAGA